MKMGISLVRTEKGKIIVRGFEPGSVAALAGFRSGDEIVSIGRKTGKQIPLNEPGGIDFRAGQKIKVLRDGAIVELLTPRREKSSAKYRALKQALDEPHADANRVVQEAYAANERGVLSDPEVQKLYVKANSARARQRRASERELPLGEIPAGGFGPAQNRFVDERHWRQQVDEDHELSPVAMKIVSIVGTRYIYTKPPKYFCAWPSIGTLRKEARCKRSAVLEAIREIEKRGHWKVVPRGGRKSHLLVLQRKPLINPDNLPDLKADDEPKRSGTSEVQSMAEDLASSENTGLTAQQQAALATGAAVLVRSRAGHLSQTKSHSAKVTPESEARRKAEAERREAVAREREFLEKIYRQQTPRGVETDYNPLAYRYHSYGSSPLGDLGDYGASSIEPRDRGWYK
jgi:hypothetical protein